MLLYQPSFSPRHGLGRDRVLGDDERTPGTGLGLGVG